MQEDHSCSWKQRCTGVHSENRKLYKDFEELLDAYIGWIYCKISFIIHILDSFSLFILNGIFLTNSNHL